MMMCIDCNARRAWTKSQEVRRTKAVVFRRLSHRCVRSSSTTVISSIPLGERTGSSLVSHSASRTYSLHHYAKATMTDNDNTDPSQKTANEDSAAAKPADPSPTLAQALYAVESLVQLFGFSPEVASQAVQEVGVDVTKCYNYILDQGLGQDMGGAVYPIDNCPHVVKEVALLAHNFQADVFERACEFHSMCKYNKSTVNHERTGNLKEVTSGNDEDSSIPACPKGENWICLKCGHVLCSRYVNGHGLEHWKDTMAAASKDEAGHCIAVSLADLSVWCHQCGSYLVHDEQILKPLLTKLEQLKFPQEVTSS